MTRPWGGLDPPGIAYVYAPGRKAKRLFSHLAGFKGVLQVDGYNAHLTDVLTRIVNGPPNRDIDQLLPRAYRTESPKAVA